MTPPILHWGSAVFVGDWTEEEAAAFAVRVAEIAAKERARAALKEASDE
jgi:hypothetical protein